MTKEDIVKKLPVRTEFTGEGVYAVLFDNGVKIGRSNYVKSRLENYLSPWNREILDIHVVYTRDSKSVEMYMLNLHKNSKIGEFVTNPSAYKLICDHMDKIVLHIHKKGIPRKRFWEKLKSEVLSLEATPKINLTA